jgi:hypothetical protein
VPFFDQFIWFHDFGRLLGIKFIKLCGYSAAADRTTAVQGRIFLVAD